MGTTVNIKIETLLAGMTIGATVSEPADFAAKAAEAYQDIARSPLIFFNLIKATPIGSVYQWASKGLKQETYLTRIRGNGWSNEHEIFMLGWLIASQELDYQPGLFVPSPSIAVAFLSLILGYETKTPEAEQAILDARKQPSLVDSVVCRSLITMLAKWNPKWRESDLVKAHYKYEMRGVTFVQADGAVAIIQQFRGQEAAKNFADFVVLAILRAAQVHGYHQAIEQVKQAVSGARANGAILN